MKIKVKFNALPSSATSRLYLRVPPHRRNATLLHRRIMSSRSVISGTTTILLTLGSTKLGNWKSAPFPPPVGMITTTKRLAAVDDAQRRWLHVPQANVVPAHRGLKGLPQVYIPQPTTSDVAQLLEFLPRSLPLQRHGVARLKPQETVPIDASSSSRRSSHTSE